MRLTFLGGAGTVTGSKYLLEDGTHRILIDCGLFQGLKRLRERNWQPLPMDPRSLDAVILTHAHLDHAGYLPVLIRNGYAGPIFCTAATIRLSAILLPDSGHLQEEEAQFANRHRFSKHAPALPLYTRAEAEASLAQLKDACWDKTIPVAGDITARFQRAGHLLGAASVLIECRDGRVLFSGDLGRPDDPVMRPPVAPPACDWLVIESTYGDRCHPRSNAAEELAPVVRRTVARGGVLVIPSFAIGRAQSLLHLIALLKRRGDIPDIPVYLNSPMASDATAIYRAFSDEHRLTAEECLDMCTAAHIVNTAEDSKRLNLITEPAVIISASGMATGGRVLHHLKAFAPSERNTILFAGFQAAGTRGAALVNGAEAVKIHGEWVPVRAEVAQLHAGSSHADRDQLLAWLLSAPSPPTQIFITHGEPAAADALRQHIRRFSAARVLVAEQGETIDSVAASGSSAPPSPLVTNTDAIVALPT